MEENLVNGVLNEIYPTAVLKNYEFLNTDDKMKPFVLKIQFAVSDLISEAGDFFFLLL